MKKNDADSVIYVSSQFTMFSLLNVCFRGFCDNRIDIFCYECSYFARKALNILFLDMHLHLIEMTDALLMDDKCTRLHEFYYLTNVSQNNLYHDVFCLFRETGVEENDELVKGITISALKALGEKYVYDFMVLQNYIVCLYGKDYIQSGAVLVEYKDYNILCYSGGRVIDGDKVQFFSLPYSGTWRLLLENLKAIYFLIKEYILLKGLTVNEGSASFKDEPKKVALASVWGLQSEIKNDLYLFDDDTGSVLKKDQVIYVFDRPDIKANYDLISAAHGKGMSTSILRSSAIGNGRASISSVSNIKLKEVILIIEKIIRITYKSLTVQEYKKSVVAEAVHVLARSHFTAHQLTALNVCGVIHYSEAGHDIMSVACAINGIARFGLNWSVLSGPNQLSMRNHTVFFCWGDNSKKIEEASGGICSNNIIVGSIMLQFSNDKKINQIYAHADTIRSNGAKCIMTLLDSTAPIEKYYQFFLHWLLDDQSIGLIIKPKKYINWDKLLSGDMKDIVSKAICTGRIIVLDDTYMPHDASAASDYTIGTSTSSALILAGLAGAKVIYLDYEKIDHKHSMLNSFSKLHTLGKGKCVFYDENTLKTSILMDLDGRYGGGLGDMRSLINDFDPYNDKYAGMRMSYYIRSYLDAVLLGCDCVDAISYANRLYDENIQLH